MQSKWMSRQGRRVMYLDYSGFRTDVDALRAEVDAANALMCAQPEGSVLALVDLRDTVASAAVVDLFNVSARTTKPYMRRLALIGISGLKRFLAEMVARVSGQEMRLFDTEEDALGWLVHGESDVGIAITPHADRPAIGAFGRSD